MRSSSYFQVFVSLVSLAYLVGACENPMPPGIEAAPSPSALSSESPQPEPDRPSASPHSPAESPDAAIETLALNQWHSLQTPAVKTTTESRAPFTVRNNYLFWQPVSLEPGARYTLLARWSDGDGRLVGLSGVHPEADYPLRTPSGLTSNQFINVAGNRLPGDRLYKLNFQVAETNSASIGYLTFISSVPQQPVEMMLQYPAEPDESVLALREGQQRGQVRTQPLYLQGAPEYASP